MKKYIIASIIALVAIVTSVNVYQTNNELKLSEIALSNVEALANGESSGTAYNAVKGDQYVNGSLKRIRNKTGGCVFENIINVQKDIDCYM